LLLGFCFVAFPFGRFVERIRQTALAAVLTVPMTCHEHPRTALGRRTLPSETGYLSVLVNLVEVENRELHLLALVSDLLRLRVDLLLSLLGTSSESKDEVERRLLLYVVVCECSPVLELFPREDQSLLIGWNPFFVLDFLLHILYGVRALNLKGDGLARESFDEDLHSSR